MDISPKWMLTEEEKNKFISMLTPDLLLLRTHADISQDELANLIGVSRQTYGAVERNVRRMSWNTYLSLILFFDHNRKTHNLLRQLSVFPTELFIHFNEGIDYSDCEQNEIFGDNIKDIMSNLDSNAIKNVKNVIKQEYMRCGNLSEGAVLRSFDGRFSGQITPEESRDIEAMKAIRAIIKNTESYEE